MNENLLDVEDPLGLVQFVKIVLADHDAEKVRPGVAEMIPDVTTFQQ